jgi:hypothetical protein
VAGLQLEKIRIQQKTKTKRVGAKEAKITLHLQKLVVLLLELPVELSSTVARLISGIR